MSQPRKVVVVVVVVVVIVAIFVVKNGLVAAEIFMSLSSRWWMVV